MTTIGELRQAGAIGVVIECRGCGTSRSLAWRGFNVTEETELSDVIARLRCKRCGRKPTLYDVDPIVPDDTPPPI